MFEKMFIKTMPYSLIAYRTLLTLSMMLILFAAGMAFAQVDSGVPADESFVDGAMHVVNDTGKNIREVSSNPTSPKILIVLIALMGVAQMFKRVGRKLPMIRGFHLGTWLDNHWWADWVVSLTLSVGGAVTAQIAAGGVGSLSLGLFVNAIVLGMATAGFGPGGSKKPTVEAAQQAGAAAAADPGKTLNS